MEDYTNGVTTVAFKENILCGTTAPNMFLSTFFGLHKRTDRLKKCVSERGNDAHVSSQMKGSELTNPL